MRLLIMNDDSHESQFCFDDGRHGNLEELLDIACAPHEEKIEYRSVYLSDIEDKFAELNPDLDDIDVEGCVANMFNILMWGWGIKLETYLASFNEIWNMAD